MHVRIAVASVLVLGLVAASAAPADSAGAGQSKEKNTRTFKGKTAQGYRIKLLVRERTFKIKTFNADLRCRDGSTLLLEEGGFLWTKIGKGGKFHDAQFGRTDSVYFKGRVTEKRLRGRIRLTDRWGKVKCHSRWIRFNAGL